MRLRTLRVPLVVTLAAVLLLGTVPSSLAADPPDESSPMEITLEHLSDVLTTLEGELAALDAPRAERLEEAVEEMTEIISDVLAAFDESEPEEDAPLPPRKIVALDRRLHELVSVLEDLLDGPARDRPNVRAGLDDLRQWVDGYVQGLTAGMDPQAARRFETTAQEMIHDVAQRIAQMAERARPEPTEHPRLERLVNQLGDLISQLDRLIHRRISHPAAQT